MHLILNPKTTLQDIQHAFQEEFPHLKLEWHTLASQDHAPLRSPGLPEAWTLETCRAALLRETLDIKPSMSVRQLCRDLQETTGLYCRILRRHENLWLEIVQSDQLSLEQQNVQGSLT